MNDNSELNSTKIKFKIPILKKKKKIVSINTKPSSRFASVKKNLPLQINTM